MTTVTKDMILKIAPNALKVDELVDAMNTYLPKFGITSQAQVAMFLAQTSHESGGFRKLEESLYYTEARLIAVWPKRFNKSNAKNYAKNPEKLANNVYSGRLGNGNEASGDGWKFRGRGLKQLTGRYNYSEFEADTGIPVVSNPDLLLQIPEAVISACWFWKKNNLGPVADAKDVVKATKIINGGDIGLKERTAAFNTLMKGVA